MASPLRRSKRKGSGNTAQQETRRLRSYTQPPTASAGASASSVPSPESTGSSPSPPSTLAPSTATRDVATQAHTDSLVGLPTGSTLAGASTKSATRPKPSIASKIKHSTTVGLESTLQALHISADVIPVLKPAVGGLIDCLDVVQSAVSSAEEYDEITSELNDIAFHLKEYLCELGFKYPGNNPACNLIASNIGKEVEHIQKKQSRNKARRVLSSTEDKEDVIKCYRRVERLFRQLQSNICLQTLRNTNKHNLTALLDRMSPVDDARYNSSYSTTIRRRGCTKETWERAQTDLQHWVQDTNGARVYWMNGMAGTGKTTIAYSLCEWLETQKQLGASFFCSRVSSSCRNVNSIIPAIAYELARYSPAFRVDLGKVLEEDPAASKLNVTQQFEKLIHGPVLAAKGAIPDGVVIVIDALDECEDSYGVRVTLEVLLRLGTNLPLKYFVASRPEPAIRDNLLGPAGHSSTILRLHDIEQSIVEEDIKKYLTEVLGPMSPHPDPEQIGQLAKLSGSLLKAVIATDPSARNKRPGNKYKQLDALYGAVIAGVLDENTLEEEEIDAMRLVLWTIVCAQEPMTIPTLASFLSLSEKQVFSTAQDLGSVVHVSESNKLVSTLHASFPEYMLDRSRCEKHHCSLSEHNKLLARRCFDIMKVQLRFNICSLESSFVFDKDVIDLEWRIANNISPELSYSCLHWGEHLYQAGFSGGLPNELLDFLSHRLLFWMEVLSLKQRIGHGETTLSRVLDSLLTEEESTKLQDFTYDARNLLTTFAGNPTSQSTPHIYLSALPFVPKRNCVQKFYLPRTQGLVRIEGAVAEGRVKFPLATWDVGSRVDRIARSSDGKRIASGSSPNRTNIWDVSSGARITDPLEGHQTQVWAVAFSPDNTRIASGSADHTIRLWDALSGSMIGEPLYGHTAGVRFVIFSPDGTRLASGSEDHTIRMWDAHMGGAIGYAYRGHEDAVLSVSFSPDGERLASGSWDYTIRVWNCQAGLTLQGPMHGHSGAVYSVAYSSDGLRLASGSRDCTVQVWSMPSGTLLVGPFEGHIGPVSSVSFSPNDTQIVSSSWDKTIRIWEAKSGNLLAGPFEGHRDPINAALFTVDGTRILSGSDDGTIRVWDARHETGTTSSWGHTGGIRCVVMSPDGARIASSSDDRTICVWDAHNGALVAGPFKGHTERVNSVAFSPDGTRIASGSSDESVLIWEVSTGTLLVGPTGGHDGSVNSVAFSPDGCQFASGSNDWTIRLWDSHTGESVAKPFEGHTDEVTSVAFSPGGSRIVSGSYDCTVQLWVADDSTTLWTSNAHINRVNCVGFSPDGTQVVSGSDDHTILVLDARDGAVLRGPFTGHSSDVYSVAFSPDGTRIVSGSRDETVRVWDVESGTVVAGPLSGHSNWVKSVAFSPGGTRIVSGSADHTIRFWDIAVIQSGPAAASSRNLLINRDGWLTKQGSKLLLWLPSALRHDFWLPSPSNPIVINGNCSTHIHDSMLLFGDRWHECFHETPPPAF